MRMAGRGAGVGRVKPACCTPRSPPGWIRAAESWTSWASCADSRRYSFTCRSRRMNPRGPVAALDVPVSKRSEEHTSELQSQSNIVCRLLLEKKKLLLNCDLPHHILRSPSFDLFICNLLARR